MKRLLPGIVMTILWALLLVSITVGGAEASPAARAGDRITWEASYEKAFQRAAAALTLMYPSIPLVFMGEEFASNSVFPFFADFQQLSAIGDFLILIMTLLAPAYFELNMFRLHPQYFGQHRHDLIQSLLGARRLNGARRRIFLHL